MSFIYITDYIRSNITQICNLTGHITCNIIKLSNIIFYLTDYEENRSICILTIVYLENKMQF